MLHKPILIFAFLMSFLPQGDLYAKNNPKTAKIVKEKSDRLHIIYTGATKKTSSVYLISALEKMASEQKEPIKINKATLVPSMRIRNLAIFSNVENFARNTLGSTYGDVIKKFVPLKKVETLKSNFDLLFPTPDIRYPIVDKLQTSLTKENRFSSKIRALIGKLTATDGKEYTAILLDDKTSYDNDVWQAQTCFRYSVTVDGVNSEIWSFGNFYGGYSSLLPMLESEIKSSKDDILLLDTGGSFDEYGFNYVEPIFKFLQYDAILPSVYDISNDYDNLVSEQNKLPLINSNVFRTDKNSPLFKDRLIITKDGIRIGIIGLVSPTKVHKNTNNIIIKDPIETAKTLLKEFSDQVDVSIALTDLTPQELSELETVSGLSMILGKDQDDVPPFPDRYTEFNQSNNSLLHYPFFVGTVGNKYFSSVKIDLKRTQSGVENKKLLWQKYPLDIYSKKDPILQALENKSITTSYGNKDPILLPDYRDLFKDKKEQKDFTYSGTEISTLMANVLLLEADADVAIYTKRSQLSSSVTGSISESIIRNWFRDKNETVVITRMDGKTLMSLIDLMQQYEQAQDPTRPPALIVGVKPEGLTVKDRPIAGTEYYTVVTVKQVFDSVDIYPQFRGLRVDKELFEVSPSGISTSSNGSKLRSTEVLIPYLKSKYDTSWDNELEEMISNPDIHEGPYFRINIKRVAFEFRGNKVTSSSAYENVPDVRVQPSDERTLSAQIDTSLELYGSRWNWETGTVLDFMNMRVTSQGTTVDVAPQDNALIYTDYKYKLWKFSTYFFGRSLGPFINIAYDTQFSPTLGNPRKKQLRFTPGLAFSDGSFLDNIRLGWVYKLDYSVPSIKDRENGVYFFTDAQFFIPSTKSSLISSAELKYFFKAPTDTDRDLGVEFNFLISLNVPIYRSFFIAPYFKYFLFRGKVEPLMKYGHANTFGVSLGFSEVIKP